MDFNTEDDTIDAVNTTVGAGSTGASREFATGAFAAFGGASGVKHRRARRHSLHHLHSRTLSDWIDDDGALLVKVCGFEFSIVLSLFCLPSPFVPIRWKMMRDKNLFIFFWCDCLC